LSLLWFFARLIHVRTLALLILAGLAPSSVLGVDRHRKPVVRPAKVKQAKTEPAFDVTAINDPQTRDEVGPNAAGSVVVRAQILLDRAHFSPGEIDGRWGDNLRVAIAGYQSARKLSVTTIVDQNTWAALNADNSPVLIPYTIATEDLAGDFEKIPHDLMQQAKLKSLGYPSPEEKLGERFHINPQLLAKLNPDKDLRKAGEQIMAPNVQRDATVPADRVVVSRNARTVTALAADGTILAQYPATMGSEHDPLPLGDWKITGVLHHPVFNYNPNLFWDAKANQAKARIPAGPRNPVGVVWIGLSKEHYGIHGTPTPHLIGRTESHGCIRLTNWDAEELSHMVKPGVPAILQE
jgi:lipoprotein-anchoring transpeptidase ErfK/SrfK